MNTNTVLPGWSMLGVSAAILGTIFAGMAGAAAQEARTAGPIAAFSNADETPPVRFQFERWMDTGRIAARNGWSGYARRHYASAMGQAWQIVPAEYLAFEALGDALGDLRLEPEAAFCYQQAIDILRGRKEIDSAAIVGRIDKKLSALPPSARQAMRPLVPPPVAVDELQKRRAGVPLEDALTAFFRDLVSLPAERQKSLLATLLPGEEDVRELFPDHADEAWIRIDKSNQSLMAGLGDWVKQAREAGPVLGVVGTLVTGENAGEYEPVLKIMSRDAIVLTAVLRRASGDTESAAYVWINGRWIWIRNLAEIPSLLQQPS